MANHNRKIILASNSPRRHELLMSAGIEHSVLKMDIDETPDEKYFSQSDKIYPVWYAVESARVKSDAALTVYTKNIADGAPAGCGTKDFPIIVTADTVVSPDGEKIFGKPENDTEAEIFLKTLSGKEHMVVGGICVTDGVKLVSSSVITRVKFREIDISEIKSYIRTGECSDKAGGYGIQGIGAFFAESICGDFSNVVGLSVFELGKILKNHFEYTLF